MERKTRCQPGLPFPGKVFEQGSTSKVHPGPPNTRKLNLSVKAQGDDSFGSAVHWFGL